MRSATLALTWTPTRPKPASNHIEPWAPYLIALIVSELSPLEAVLGDSDAPAVRKTPAALDDDLQVDSRFADAIAFRLAGLLVLNESREKADSLFDGYKTQIDAVRAALTSHDKITEVY